jgi:lysozyme
VKINSRGIELIKKYEDCVLTPYICPAGVPTIYYGHVIKKGEVFAGTHEEANEVLLKDIQKVEDAILDVLHVTPSSNQFSAIVSLVYNIGINAFRYSTLLVLLNKGLFDEAANQFERWIFVKRKRIKGLQFRRMAEKELFESFGEELSLFPEKIT